MNGKKKAFTLTELLVVIAIIGAVAALLLPAIASSKRKAQQIQCVGNLHQLGLALQSFVSDNHVYPTSFAGPNARNPGFWATQLEHGGVDVTKFDTNMLQGVWRCPSAHWAKNITLKILPFYYGYNVKGVYKVGNTNPLGLDGEFNPASKLYTPVRESEVVCPSDMMAIGESFNGGIFFTRYPDLQYLERDGYALSRHGGRINVTFCDGHVDSPKLGFVFTNTSDDALVRWNRDHQPHQEAL